MVPDAQKAEHLFDRALDFEPAERAVFLAGACPMCDESFIPNYLRECEWCNYDFGHGLEKPLRFDESIEPANWRVALLITALVGFAGLLILYVNLVMRR
jgi:hypothetical protein